MDIHELDFTDSKKIKVNKYKSGNIDTVVIENEHKKVELIFDACDWDLVKEAIK